MNEAKPFASLSSGLLARKGAARPAMRPQGFGQFGGGLEDLGWNDMGQAAAPTDAPRFQETNHDRAPSPISALTPMSEPVAEEEDFEPAPPVVELQRAAIEARFSEPTEVAQQQPDVDRIVLATKAKKMALEPVAEPEPVLEPEDDSVLELGPASELKPEPAPVEMPLAAAPTRRPSKVEREQKAKAAFTLRLDGDRHLKLRLACAVSGRSAQQIVTEALDELLSSRPDVAALAEQVPGKHK